MFFSSACIMILELVAGRIIASQVGVSLYTWTSVIGVILAGISIGNYFGGWLADRWASMKTLGLTFIAGGLFTVFILVVNEIDILDYVELSYIAETMTLITAMFFVPSAILGAISPLVVKLSIHDLSKTGSTVGRIYAAGAIGSIAGTFATGFVLISWFGTHTIIWGVGIALTTLGLVFLLSNKWSKLLSVALIIFLFLPPSFIGERLHRKNIRETNYFTIKVKESNYKGEPVLKLYLDQLLHGYTFLNDPARLKYSYLKMFAWITTHRALNNDNLSTMIIGGGGYTFPNYLEATYLNSKIHVIEIDPEVTEVAHERLGLSRDTGIVTFNQDARLYFEREPNERYDLIYADAFNDFSVPFHLTTVEFNQTVSKWLAEDGIYLVNIIDGPKAKFLSAYTYTLRQTFKYVYAGIDARNWRKYRSTHVLAASNTPLDFEAMEQVNEGVKPTAHRLLSEEKTTNLFNKGTGILLTDRYAPVDQLLASVFRDHGED